jgi:hypothetical protein
VAKEIAKIKDDLQVDELRLHIGRDGSIRVEGDRPDWLGAVSSDLRLGLNLTDPQDTRRQLIGFLLDMLRDGRLRRKKECMLLGAMLHSVLFENSLGDMMHMAIRRRSFRFLQILLQFAEVPGLDLGGWPWEYLFVPRTMNRPDGGYFLGEEPRVSICRRLPDVGSTSPRVEAPPVNVLFVASSPDGKEVHYHDALETIQGLKLAGRGPDTRVSVLPLLPGAAKEIPTATYEEFKKSLGEEPKAHIVHFIGHGDFSDGQGRILFMGKDRREDPVTDQRLAHDIANIVKDCAVPLRLVVLQACMSAMSDSNALVDRYQAVSGLALSLAMKEVPAVVAMHFTVDEEAANVFTGAFYPALAASLPLGAALQYARGKVREWEEGQEYLELSGAVAVAHPGGATLPAFALPMLYVTKHDSVFPDVAPTNGGHMGDSGPETRRCWCGAVYDQGDRFCSADPPHAVKCKECGWEPRRQQNNCGECGSPLPMPMQLNVAADLARSVYEAGGGPAGGGLTEKVPKKDHLRGGMDLGGQPGQP